MEILSTVNIIIIQKNSVSYTAFTFCIQISLAFFLQTALRRETLDMLLSLIRLCLVVYGKRETVGVQLSA